MDHANFGIDPDPARLRLVGEIWNWLPAFRAVAESNHLPTASERLHVSPSALSRTIGLLEEALGTPLFHRTGRRLELNARGKLLLESTRDATRLVHDGVESVLSTRRAGVVRIGASGFANRLLVAPALAALARTDPQLEPVIEAANVADVRERLIRGDLDVALLSGDVAWPDIQTVHLGSVPNRVFCGPLHPLYDAAATLDDVLQHAFAAPSDRDGRPVDGWPATTSRRVQWRVWAMDLGVRLCASGAALAVLPAPVGIEAGLRALPGPDLATLSVVALRRAALVPGDRASAVIDAARDVLRCTRDAEA